MEPDELLAHLRKREIAAHDQTRLQEQKGVIMGLILLLGVLLGCFLGWLAAKGVQ